MKTVILTTILLLTNLFLNLQSQAQCHIDDWTALKALYESTDGDNWENKQGWEEIKGNAPTTDTDCFLRNLFGIELNREGRVYYLNLYSNQLSGSIPPEIGNLSKLTELWLSSNQLSGSIPPEIGNLSKLTYLMLHKNELSGSIPPEIGNLSKLNDLWLYNNQLSGSIPKEIGNLSNLRYLYLSSNQLSGSIPKEIGNLSKLTELNLISNQLNGSIPKEIGNLSNLRYLHLSSNQLSGSIPQEISNLSKLTELSLSSNQLSGSIPPEIGNLSNLTKLRLSSNELSGSIPPEIGKLKMLTSLYLENNQLSGSIPPELGNLTSLVSLWMFRNQLSGSIPPELGLLKNLEFLDFYKNKLTGDLSFFTSNELSLNIKSNYFTCKNVKSYIENNSNVSTAHFRQYFKPVNYNEIETNIFDTLSNSQQLNLNIKLPWENTSDFTYQWKRNGNEIVDATNVAFSVAGIQPSNAGKYTLHVYSDSCLPDGNTFEAISEPMYVFVKGFDLLGQQVEYTQLMVEFEDQTTKDHYEQEIFFDNGGIWADKCDCNRELHLYDFPNDSSSIQEAYFALDQKIKRIKIKNEIDGGFNYKLNNIGLNALSMKTSTLNPLQNAPPASNHDDNAYTVSYNYPSANYDDQAQVYLLDSGLDESNFGAASNFLLTNAPVDSCYNLRAPGYNFTKVVHNLKDYNETIDTDYEDREGHGTYGFRTISQGLEGAENTQIVPLKIIENATDGNLFDLICALYHAVDHNADVINISAGFRGEPSGILENALYQAREKGIFVVAAAGNDALNIDSENEVPQYPAYYASQYHTFYKEGGPGEPILDSVRYDNVKSVAAVNINNQLNKASTMEHNQLV